MMTKRWTAKAPTMEKKMVGRRNNKATKAMKVVVARLTTTAANKVAAREDSKTDMTKAAKHSTGMHVRIVLMKRRSFNTGS